MTETLLLLLQRLADMPFWAAWLIGPVLINWSARQAARLPSGWGRLAQVAFWWGLAALLMRLARHGWAEWDIPLAVWITGALLLPWWLLGSGSNLVRQRLAMLAWLLCLASLVVWGADRGGWTLALNGGLFAVAGGAWGLVTLYELTVPRPPAAPAPPPLALPSPPPPSPPPPRPAASPKRRKPPAPPSSLQDHLDSDEAQEGADKYTRE
ncbi:MAG: hypothetical protein V4739_12410 [Pseudomonadota bacterium]